MNRRQKELLRILLTDLHDFFHIQDLADELDCSEKTVRNDLNRIETMLTDYPSAELKRKRGMGIALDAGREDKAELLNRIYQTEAITGKDRLLEMAYQLLISNKPLTLASLAEKYFTNRTTVRHELGRIADWLEGYDLKLESKQRLGHFINGHELNKRNALANLPELIPSESYPKQQVLQLFSQHEINTVRKHLQDLQIHYPIDLTAGEFESLHIHALIMIKRTRQRSPILLGQSDDTGVKLDTYHMTAWLLKRLENALGLSFPKDEYIYFTWHLESCRTAHAGQAVKSDDLVAGIVHQMTAQLRRMTMIRFGDDKVLTDGLEIHLASALHRIRYGLTIRNPMLSDIKKTYAYMFSMVILAVEKINEAYNLNIPEDEAAYLVLHFQASIERMQKERTTAKRTVIVCDLGVGMSHLLQAKLEQSYKGLDILASIGKAELPAFLENQDVDMLISTTEIYESEVPVLVVSPLLESDDKERLEQFIQSIDQEETTEKEMMTKLKQLVDTDAIYMGMALEHRFEIVEMLADNLVQNGFAEKAFVHSAMLRERTSATAVGGGIAIPHADPEFVKKTVVSLAVLREPVQWGRDMVSVVFLLAIAKEDQKMTQSLMQTIASISQHPTIVEQLTQAESTSDMLTVFEQ
ncbi:transcriptional regulator ManR [Lentibacillus kapialis]|uniref:Transcriptional regulator ManR n=1 Tax=Lentibacillus kapialis TaxID=340214 RepID=A0A917UYA0_9BACI|nr:BglG family transcription antiterminator [Lentibacillus kapialis]GGJ95722.1 transcriptional regulator ManR [Lentibacillus kapialis]